MYSTIVTTTTTTTTTISITCTATCTFYYCPRLGSAAGALDQLPQLLLAVDVTAGEVATVCMCIHI